MCINIYFFRFLWKYINFSAKHCLICLIKMKDIENPNFYENTGESLVRTCFASIAELNPLTSALAKAYFLQMDDKRWRQVKEFFENVKLNMEEHEQKINDLYEITDTEEILNLMLTTIDKVQFEYKKTKRDKYAEIFVNSILIGNTINYDEKRMFIQLFSELSEADIDLLGKFNHKTGFKLDLEEYLRYGSTDGSSGLEEVVPLVTRLEARGLISEIPSAKNPIFWEERPDSFDSIWRNKIYTLTPLGRSFWILLQENE